MDLCIGVNSTSSFCLAICFNGLACLRRQHTCFSKVSLQHRWRNLTTIIHNLYWLMFFIYLLSFNVKCRSSHEMYYNCVCVCLFWMLFWVVRKAHRRLASIFMCSVHLSVWNAWNSHVCIRLLFAYLQIQFNWYSILVWLIVKGDNAFEFTILNFCVTDFFSAHSINLTLSDRDFLQRQLELYSWVFTD